VADCVLYEVKNRVALITLNQPASRNALSEAVTEALRAALRAAQQSPDVTAILLTGAGETFSAGGDLREFRQKLSQPSLQVYDEGKSSSDLFKELGALRKPLIGAVNGSAFGGGCGLACACHVVIASDRAKFGCTEVNLGLFPMVILPAVRRAVGDRKARELCITGAVLTAEQAREIGIVSKVVPAASLAEEAWTLASKVASFSSVALRVGLEGFALTTDMEYAKAVDHLNTLRVVAFQTEDLLEGATAFLEKRSPQWKGR
jgi:methylglutaconyl-CoA hydratase